MLDGHTDYWDLPDGTGERLSAFSLIDEAHGRRVRMGHLAFLGSHKVNGVSKLHSDLMKVTVFRDWLCAEAAAATDAEAAAPPPLKRRARQ